MRDWLERFLADHERQTRRFFLSAGAMGVVALKQRPSFGQAPPENATLKDAIAGLESFFTLPGDFRDVSRGKPIPHTLPDDKKSAVGLTRENWRLEVVSDPEHPARIRRPLSGDDALDFPGLLELAKQHSVKFAKVMTCLNIGCPLGTGIWEGVPLREIVWLTEPRENLRRVYYHGYHNDDPKQLFQSSLPVGRVLEDPFDLPPVILCYKLNGQWLTSERGGPVRVVVPEAYGFKSIKWLNRVVLSNLFHANDTYANGNNDVDSSLKTFAATLSVPKEVKAGVPLPITGYAQVGISGLSKVQVWVHRNEDPLPSGDRFFQTAPWKDAKLLPAPASWGGGLPGDKIPMETMGFEPESGRPRTWPIRLAKAHWAILLPGLPAGEYTLRSRTIDDKGHAQPMPRPFRKSGHSAIEQIRIKVAA